MLTEQVRFLLTSPIFQTLTIIEVTMSRTLCVSKPKRVVRSVPATLSEKDCTSAAIRHEALKERVSSRRSRDHHFTSNVGEDDCDYDYDYDWSYFDNDQVAIANERISDAGFAGIFEIVYGLGRGHLMELDEYGNGYITHTVLGPSSYACAKLVEVVQESQVRASCSIPSLGMLIKIRLGEPCQPGE